MSRAPASERLTAIAGRRAGLPSPVSPVLSCFLPYVFRKTDPMAVVAEEVDARPRRLQDPRRPGTPAPEQLTGGE